MTKLKGCSKAIKMKYLLFVFATAVLVSLPTRVYQLLALVNAQTGFYDDGDITVPVLYGVLAIFTLLFVILSFLSKEVPSPKLPVGKNPILGVASAILSVGFLWDILSGLRNAIPGVDGDSESFFAILKINLAQSGGAILVLRLIFAFFSIFYLLIFAISNLNGKASYKEYKLLALSPVCWGTVSLIGKLMNPVSYITVSELLFEIAMFAFATVFFLAFARISTGVFTEDGMWIIYGCGFSAALFAGLVTIPRIVCSVVSLPSVEGHEFSFAHFSIFIFVVAYILASLGIGFKDGLKNMRTANAIDFSDDENIMLKQRTVCVNVVDEVEDFGNFEYEEETQPEYELVDTIENTVYEEPIAGTPVIDEEPISEEVENYFETFEEPIAETPTIDEELINEEVEGYFETFEEPIVETPIIDEEPINEEVEGYFETFEEPIADTFEENITEVTESVEESEIIETPKAEEKPKKAKKEKAGFFTRKKSAPEVDDIPEDLKPISLADLKNKE